MSIFKNEKYLNPKYSYLDKYVKIMFKGYWTPAKYEKLIAEQDIPYYFNEMNPVSKETIKRCILAVATVEDKVKSFWNVIFLDLPQTIIGDVSGVFANSEVVHRRAYHSLVENLKINLEEINENEYLNKRLKYLGKHIDKDTKLTKEETVLKKLVLFTSLVERISLFTQFYILMSFSKRNKELNTISALQQTTAKEELVHYYFGMDLINEIKKDHPEAWSSYVKEVITKNIKDAYTAELKLLDWFFENGVPSHLTREEVINFLHSNFNSVFKDLGLDIRYPVDQKLFETKNIWFLEKTLNTLEPDFFDNAVGGYSHEDVDINVDSFSF